MEAQNSNNSSTLCTTYFEVIVFLEIHNNHLVKSEMCGGGIHEGACMHAPSVAEFSKSHKVKKTYFEEQREITIETIR